MGIVTRLSKWGNVDVVYSPDDGGWYAQRWSDDQTTPIYQDQDTLIDALVDGTAKWD